MLSPNYNKNSKQILPLKMRQKTRNLLCIKKILSHFPKGLTSGILYFFLDETVLKIVVKSSAFKQDFLHKKTLFMDMLEFTDCKDLNLTDIKVYVNRDEKKEKIMPKKEIFIEKSKGLFINSFTDPSLKQIAEEIREIIKNK